TPRLFSSPPNRRHLRDLIRKHRQWISKHLASELMSRYGLVVSPQTVRRERLRMGFNPVHFHRKPTLTSRTKLRRLLYCLLNEEEEWDDIWFSDEKLFRVDFSAKKIWK